MKSPPDPVAVPLLLGLGVDELSVSPPEIPLVKAVVRERDLVECAGIAARALTATSAAEIRAVITYLYLAGGHGAVNPIGHSVWLSHVGISGSNRTDSIPTASPKAAPARCAPSIIEPYSMEAAKSVSVAVTE